MIEIKNLCKSFGDNHVLCDITETINEGDKVVIVGPSGSGKSTFLRCLNCMEDPTSGSIIFEGEDLADMKVDINKHRQQIGMVFQQFNLFNNKTVMENITLAPVHLKKMTPEEAKKKAIELLRRVDLEDKADVYPSTLSGGQKQRVSIARALVRKPEILILDDSASALDYATDAAMRSAISALPYHPTVFIVSQRAGSVLHADRILVLEDGEAAGYGTPDELLKSCEIYREIYYCQFPDEENRSEKKGE